MRLGNFQGTWRAYLVTQMVKNLPAVQETWVWSLGREDCLEKEMATHSSTLAWRIPWTEEPGGLQSTGLQRVGHDWMTNTFTFPLSGCLQCFPSAAVVKNLPTSTRDTGDMGSIPGSGRSARVGYGNPPQYSCLGNSTDRGHLWALVHGVTSSQTGMSAECAYTSHT